MENKSGSVSPFMTRKRLQVELQRCEYCEEKPCQGACPADCSPYDFIMAARSRKNFDGAINIPQVQATIVQMAKELGGIPDFAKPPLNGKKIAVVGGGPAGLGAAAALAQLGYAVDVFESH